MKPQRTVTNGLMILFVVAGAVIDADKPNFTGIWVMDKSKSEGVASDVQQTMTLTQVGDKLTLMNKVASDDGEFMVNDVYEINGKEVEFVQKRDDDEAKGKRTSKWLADGSGFESSEEITVNTGDGLSVVQHIKKKWIMAPDGKSFTVELDLTGPNGSRHTKRTFVKK